MSTTTEDVALALEGLREGFRADGADLELVGVQEGRAHIRLIGTDETCWDCIVPPDVLRQVVTKVIEQSCHDLEGIQVEDPRDREHGADV